MLSPATTPEWAKEDEVAAGDVLIADAGFTCLTDGAKVVVEQDDRGLFVPCAEGHHYLDGQLEDSDRYIGFVMASGDGVPRLSPGQAAEGSPC